MTDRRWTMIVYAVTVGSLALGLTAEFVLRARAQSAAAAARAEFNAAVERVEAVVAARASAEDAREKVGAWTAHVRAVDVALARRDAAAAEEAWRAAYREAIRAYPWRAAADVGDAALRMTAPARPRGLSRARARELYVVALGRVRSQESTVGALRLAEAFAYLGEPILARDSVRVAEALMDAHRPQISARGVGGQ